jgi:hypothetical protein
MTRALTDLRAAELNDGGRFEKLRQELKSAFGKRQPSQYVLYVRDGYSRLLKAAALNGGGLGLRLWGLWYYRQTAWLIVLGLVILLPVALAFPPLLIPAVIFGTRYLRRE